MMKSITERNKKVLQVIGEHGYVTYKEIENITGTKRQAFRVIDSMMNSYKFIESFDTGLMPSKGYYLTKKGGDTLSVFGTLRVCSLFKPCDFGPSEFYHNLSIIHARLALEKHPYFLDFETPRVLLAKRGELPELKPDAEVIFKEDHTPETLTIRTGLEIELRPKWHERNIKKMKKFDTGNFSYLNNIIWVCNDNITIDALCRAIKAGRIFEPSKHRFLLLNDLLKNGVFTCKITDWQGKDCSLFTRKGRE